MTKNKILVNLLSVIKNPKSIQNKNRKKYRILTQHKRIKLIFVNSSFSICAYNFIRRLLILKIHRLKKESIKIVVLIELLLRFLILSKKRKRNQKKEDLK